MWKRTTIAAGVLLGLIGCEEPAEESVEIRGETAERRQGFEPTDDEHGSRTNEGIDTASLNEERPPVGRTDCVAPTDPACTTEPRPSAMRDTEAAAGSRVGSSGERTEQPTQRPSEADSLAPEPELSTVTSDADLAETTRRVTAALRQAGLEIVGTARYDERDRQRAEPRASADMARRGDEPAEVTPEVDEQQTEDRARSLEGTTGQARPDAIGDVRMVVFRSPQAESRAIADRGIEALFSAPRTLAVFERGEEVAVAWSRPDEPAQSEDGAPLGAELDRVIAEAVVDRSEARERAEASPSRPGVTNPSSARSEPRGAAASPPEHPRGASDSDRTAQAPPAGHAGGRACSAASC